MRVHIPAFLAVTLITPVLAQTTLINETFNGGLPGTYLVQAGTANVSGGALVLSSGCVRLPGPNAGGTFSRSNGLSIDADVNITDGSIGDFNIFGFYDSLIDCPNGPHNGYYSGWYPAGSDNPQNLFNKVVNGAGQSIGTRTTTLTANQYHHIKIEYTSGGIVNMYLDGALIITASDNTYTSGLITLRSWQTVNIDNLVVQTLNSSAASPAISSFNTNPNPPLVNQQFTLTINGSNFDPASAQVLINGPGCAPCVNANGLLTTKTNSLITTPVTLGTTGTFTVTVQNVASGLTSNAPIFTVNAQPGPSISSFNTNPNPPLVNQQFTLTINGSNFDPASAQVLINGPGCAPCVNANGLLTTKTNSLITTPVTLGTTGTFTVTVQNVASGLTSNAPIFTVNAQPGPSISSFNTNPNPPLVNQQFTLTINGSNFDPASAQVLINGPGCAPCVNANGLLTTKTNSLITTPVTLGTTGTFTVTVQNVASGLTSNAPIFTVNAQPGPSISSFNTNPNPPLVNQQFTLTINGSNFDPASAQVLINGPGCAPCVNANGLLTTKTNSLITTPVTLGTTGTFTVTVQNVASGLTSNAPIFTVNAQPGPSISSFNTSPNPPLAGQLFNFSITGNNFDSSGGLQILMNGGGCNSCNILIATTSAISGTATLNAGTYTVTVKNLASGFTSNGSTLTVNALPGPSISGFTTSPNPPLAGQPFNFSITGNNFDSAAGVQVLMNDGTCNACIILIATPSAISGTATLNSGTYTVKVKNVASGAVSSGLTFTVGAVGLSISSLSTSPNPPLAGQQFNLNIAGGGFDPSTAQVLIDNTVRVINSALTSKSASTLVAPLNLGAVGQYSVSVRNTSTGAISNSVILTIGAGHITLNSITPSNSQSFVGQSTTLTATGSNFDPGNAQFAINGPGCSPCTIPNGSLLVKTTTSVAGPFTWPSAGTYSVSIQNGAIGGSSNPVNLTAGPAPTPTITSLSQISAVAGQQFSLTINGANFDPSTVQMVLYGPDCPTYCPLPNSLLATRSFSSITGPAILSKPGKYLISVRNGDQGYKSNTLDLMVTTSGRVFLITFTGFNDSPKASGSEYSPTEDLDEDGRGMTIILDTVRRLALKNGTKVAANAFTFYTAKGNDGGGPLVRPSQVPVGPHAEAHDWLQAQLGGSVVQPTDRIIIVGHSYGGYRAMKFAQQVGDEFRTTSNTPAKVETLILVDPIDWTLCGLSANQAVLDAGLLSYAPGIGLKLAILLPLAASELENCHVVNPSSTFDVPSNVDHALVFRQTIETVLQRDDKVGLQGYQLRGSNDYVLHYLHTHIDDSETVARYVVNSIWSGAIPEEKLLLRVLGNLQVVRSGAHAYDIAITLQNIGLIDAEDITIQATLATNGNSVNATPAVGSVGVIKPNGTKTLILSFSDKVLQSGNAILKITGASNPAESGIAFSGGNSVPFFLP